MNRRKACTHARISGPQAASRGWVLEKEHRAEAESDVGTPLAPLREKGPVDDPVLLDIGVLSIKITCKPR